MSELGNLFYQHKRKHTPPVKRLFSNSHSKHKQKEERSIPPQKSILKVEHKLTQKDNKKHILSHVQFPKKYLSKDVITKQINNYNQLVLVSYFRKMFFITVILVLASYFANCTHHQIILVNLMFTIALLDCPLSSDFLGSRFARMGKTIFTFLAYYMTFLLIFKQLYNQKDDIPPPKVQLLALCGVLNYVILTIGKPFIFLRSIVNIKQPYKGIFHSIKRIINLYLNQLGAILQYYKIFLFVNLFFWLIVTYYIIHQQNEQLFDALFTIKIAKTTLSTILLLFSFQFVIKILNESLGVDILQPNRKQISLNFLRLANDNSNNKDLKTEITKYIWSNCESFWDTDFLSHNYVIQYDILEDYLFKQLENIADQMAKGIKNSQKGHFFQQSLVSKCLGEIQRIELTLRLGRLLMEKRYIFFIIEQIRHFDEISSLPAIHLDPLLKRHLRMENELEEFGNTINIVEIKASFIHFVNYLSRDIRQK